MKISIVENGRRIVIPLPTRLLLSSTSIRLIAKCMKRYKNPPLGEDHWSFLLDEEKLRLLAKELIHAKAIFGRLVLVDVVSHDGTKVKITL